VTCSFCSVDPSLAHPAAPFAPGAQLHLDEHWRLVHARPTSVTGWLVLVLRRHVEALHELTDDEAAGLGRWLVPVCRALHRVTGCEVEYVAQLADSRADPHVHVHLIARGPGWPRCRTGAAVLGDLGSPGSRPVSEDSIAVLMQQMAVALHPACS
jgi:diadenosine tetraphosphate (Ap4A) HIT family hydrolase